MPPVFQQDIEYVDIQTTPARQGLTSFYQNWIDQSSAKHATPELIAADTLRRMHPGHSLVISDDYRLASLFALPGIGVHPADSGEPESEQVSNVVFTPMPRRTAGNVAGSLVNQTILGSYRITWNVRELPINLIPLTGVEQKSDFMVHITKFQIENFVKTVHFFLHEGPEQPARDLVLAACVYAEQTHDEIWVFNRGFWSKDATLWLEITNSSWSDVVMKKESKEALQKDVYGFFKSEITYRKLSIPWKRGLIMHGPPGNGKTISIKAIMKTCTEHGFTPLYVESFHSMQGEEAAMQNVFLKARQLAPCVLILEDLDSLINDGNRSFFLNQLDGLEGNGGLLVIASTNHFDRLDPGLSNRPSRFDRKYLFDDPGHQERMLYAKYWREKLKNNDEIFFPESLVEEVADLTQGFSFAYLKEAFVSTLVQINNADNSEEAVFQVVLKREIMVLRKELGKQTHICNVPHLHIPGAQPEETLDARIPLQRQPSITFLKDKFVRASRVLKEPSLPKGTSDDLPSSQPAWTVHQFPVNSPRPRATEAFHGVVRTPTGIPFPQRRVLHAPPSAYPQVMPGSLPSTTPIALQDPIHPAWHGSPMGSSASTSGVDISPRNTFSIDNSPLIKLEDDVHTERPSAFANRDI